MLPDQVVPQEVTRALRDVLGECLVGLVLYGSRARGDARPESDWDVLLIAEQLPEQPFARHLFLKRALPAECRGMVSFLAKTPKEFEAGVSSLYLDIAADGTVLYDPRGYAKQKLDELRRLIRREGLHRERTPAGDVWRWDQAPAQPWTLEWGA